MQEKEKLTEQIRIAIGESAFAQLARLAAEDDRTLSEFCRVALTFVLELHIRGVDISVVDERHYNTKAPRE